MKKKLFSIIITTFVILTVSCALSRHVRLKSEGVTDTGTVKGSYDLILYGNRYGDDIKTVAILDNTSDAYTFEPNAPAYDYTIKSGLEGNEALQEAANFVSSHSAYWTNRIKRISDSEGNVLGYEVRPLYRRHRYGYSDMLNVDYFLKDEKVSVFIGLKTFIEKSFRKREHNLN
jgi:hypothetical protein